jgi:hypothetical protein
VAFISWRDCVQSRIVKLGSFGSDRCRLIIVFGPRGGLRPPIIRKCDEGTRRERSVSGNESWMWPFSFGRSKCDVTCSTTFSQCCSVNTDWSYCVSGPELRCIGGVRDLKLLKIKVKIYRNVNCKATSHSDGKRQSDAVRFRAPKRLFGYE